MHYQTGQTVTATRDLNTNQPGGHVPQGTPGTVTATGLGFIPKIRVAFANGTTLDLNPDDITVPF